ncbi:carboxypeptidase-like regulatory domain-containing protein [Hymenobacter aerilatus]|uniref:Carboxypeptidase-like regulatory domain-containing protein n=1 Tax=Hymenobacter aerilatus TaxID=2932251 RepID=A0A8T9SV34_9BACT|nr:carboxypeptidase-like regulatory domain-containing protein [Hymenobacter aerilatus]UOR05755.1 carboxypeptidase-like regulatory domain-containing protein [Hymenobacter aerilatus]
MRRVGFLLLLFFCLAKAASAQITVRGVARDSLTHEPLGFASVFLANTTYGATTDAQGRFELRGVAAGPYELLVSYLGYQLYRKAILVQDKSLTVNPQLLPTAQQLAEVVVRPHKNNPDDYRTFEEYFLGSTTFSQQCRIRNPDDVLVDYDPQAKELTATSRDFVLVENRALGYRVKYYGLHFSVDFKRQFVQFYGSPVFEEMRARNARQQRRWADNRRQAYHGSQIHFLRSVYENRVEDQGFRVQKLRIVDNPRRARADSIMQHLLATLPPGQSLVLPDSLQRQRQEPRSYGYLYTRPLPIDSLRQLVADTCQLRFHDLLQITYLPEKPDPRYRPEVPGQLQPGPAPTEEVSTLYLQVPSVQIFPNGRLAHPLAIYNDGYWGFEKMGEMLPYDYIPPKQ